MTQYYRHFRNGQLYRLLTFATIEATGEEADNFFEEVMREGKMVPRFQPVE